MLIAPGSASFPVRWVLVPKLKGPMERRLHDDVEAELTHHRAAVEVALDALDAARPRR